MSLPTLARLSAVPLAVGAVVLGVAAPASAHVTISASTTAAGAFAVLTVSVPHGCEGSPTTEITIQVPEEINAVTPTRNPLWEVEKQVEQLDPPVTDAHGNEITERVATVTYTATTPLPEGYRDAFELSLQLPDEEGATLVFPTIQTCEEGESAWIEVAEEGQSAEELELPAPSLTITSAEGDAHGSGEPAQAAEDSSDLGPWALGAGILGVLVGAFAVVQARRRP
jgi:periplasmic copper chaperone A